MLWVLLLGEVFGAEAEFPAIESGDNHLEIVCS